MPSDDEGGAPAESVQEAKIVSAVPTDTQRSEVHTNTEESDFVYFPQSTPTFLEPRQPRKYKPERRGDRSKHQQEKTRTAVPSVQRAFPIVVRLIFERGGYSRITFLAGRLPELPSPIAVTTRNGALELSALTDEWYEQGELPNLGQLLEQGVEWITRVESDTLRWSLSGREIYVLGPSDDVFGYLFTNRLRIGEEHVVLSTHAMRPEVERMLRESSGPSLQVLSEGEGLPSGWVAFRGVIPTRPLTPSKDGSILDCLCPVPDVEISIAGGIRLSRSAWLIGYPPRIRLRGDVEHVRQLSIDGTEAILSGDGSYTVLSWDQEGIHTVTCEALSRSYEIAKPPEGWSDWPAYSFALGRAPFSTPSLGTGICGALVRPLEASSSENFLALVPSTHPVVLGAEPGQVFVCLAPRSIHPSICVSFVPFEPVWAAPADPLHVDRSTVRVLLVGRPSPPAHIRRRSRNFRGSLSARRWAEAILNCSRKRLAVEPDEDGIRVLWQAYKDVARQLRRLLR